MRVALKVDAERGLTIVGNRELIGQAVANLVDNAVKYGAGEAKEPGSGGPKRDRRGPRGATATSSASRSPTTARAFRPPTARARCIASSGWRTRARAPASGLGLSLAAAVMRMHGGEARLEDNAPGLRVVVTLPAAAPALPLSPPAEAAA